LDIEFSAHTLRFKCRYCGDALERSPDLDRNGYMALSCPNACGKATFIASSNEDEESDI